MIEMITQEEFLENNEEITMELVESYHDEYFDSRILGLLPPTVNPVLTTMSAPDIDNHDNLSSGVYNGTKVTINEYCMPIRVTETEEENTEVLAEERHIIKLARFSPKPLMVNGLGKLQEIHDEFYGASDVEITWSSDDNVFNAFVSALSQQHIEYIDQLQTTKYGTEFVYDTMKFQKTMSQLPDLSGDELNEYNKQVTDYINKSIAAEFGELGSNYRSLVPEIELGLIEDEIELIKDDISPEEYSIKKQSAKQSREYIDAIYNLQPLYDLYMNNPDITRNMISEFRSGLFESTISRYMASLKRLGLPKMYVTDKLASHLDDELKEHADLFYYSIIRMYVYMKPHKLTPLTKGFQSHIGSLVYDFMGEKTEFVEPEAIQAHERLQENISQYLQDLINL